MKKSIFLFVLFIMFAPPLCAERNNPPKWFYYTMAGVSTGVFSLYVARDAHRLRERGLSDGREGNRIFAEKEELPFLHLTYQERAVSLWGRRSRDLHRAEHIKQAAVIIGVVSASCFGFGVTYGARGVLVKKSFHFGGKP